MIIGFLRSPRWKTPVMSFLDEFCIQFDNEEENKLEFTQIHNVNPPLLFRLHFVCRISKSWSKVCCRN